MGQWRYADRGVCYQDEEAIARALAAPGKRNLFHDDTLLVLEHEDDPPGTSDPPGLSEPAQRRLVLTLARSDWLGPGSTAGAGRQTWHSEPLPPSAGERPPAGGPPLDEARLSPAAHAFFTLVHADLHGSAQTGGGTGVQTLQTSAQTGEQISGSHAAFEAPAAWTAPASRSRRPRLHLLTLLCIIAIVASLFSVGMLYRLTGEGSRSLAWSTAASRPSTAQVSAIAAAVTPGMVDISIALSDPEMRGEGTGIVLTAGGEVLTNNHVIDGATAITVTDLSNGLRYQGSVVGYDRSLDLAVVQMTGASGLPTIRLGDSSRLRLGEAIVALGNAFGRGGAPSTAAGSLVALDQRTIAEDRGGGNPERLSGLIGVDAAVQPGDSGGPLVDAAGRTIGITTAGRTHPGSRAGTVQAFAIPIRQALWVATQVMSGRSSASVHIGPTAFLGVRLTAAGEAEQGPDAQAGATVSAVVGGSPADQARLRTGDLLISLGGRSVGSQASLAAALDRWHPADRVTLSWTDPAGQRHDASVLLAVGPAG